MKPRAARDRVTRRRRRTAGVSAAVAVGAGLIAGPIWSPALAAAVEVRLRAAQEAWYHDATAGVPAPLGDATPAQAPDPTVPPGSLPAGLRHAEHAYRSVLRFELGSVPERALVTSFVVTMRQTTEVGAVPGVEACALTAPFRPGPNQPMARLPGADCVFSASGVRPEDDPATPADNESALWTFDLTDTARAWVSGQVTNHGIMFQFTSPDNLPVGEPNPAQSSGRLTWAGKATRTPPHATFAYAPPPAAEGGPLAPRPPAPRGARARTGGLGFASAPALEPAPAAAVGPAPEPGFAPPVIAPPAAAPPVAGEAPAAPVAQPPAVAVAASKPRTPAYVWLLVPVGLAAMYVLTRSLTAEPRLVAEREGAVTRLMRRRRADLDPSATGPPRLPD